MTLNESIREMRKKKGLTQEALAEFMGVSTASVSKWENGQAAPELGMLVALADYFEISVDALLGHQVRPERKKAMLEDIVALGEEGRFEEAKALAATALRNYPNCAEVIDAAAKLNYRIHVVTGDKDAMKESIALVRRLFPHTEEEQGRLTLLNRLANQYELLGDLEQARKYYEEGNISEVNDRALAYLRARERADGEAVNGISRVFCRDLSFLVIDCLRLSEVYTALEQKDRAREALLWGLDALGGLGGIAGERFRHLRICLHLSLSGLAENEEQAQAEVRKAIRIAGGEDVKEGTRFLTDCPDFIFSQSIGSADALAALVGQMENEEA